MGKMLIEHGIPNKDVLIWPRDKTVPRPSNTGREILNIFELAIKKQCESVGIVTVGVHLPRTALYVSRHLRSARFSSLSVRFLESEEVLLTTTCSSPLSAMDVGDIHPPSGKLVARIAALRRSQAFQRTWKREELGIWRVLRGEYNDGKEGGNTTS
jgi:uncharacterized SAM-binding protein YcdF (DUF218 family)